MCKISVITSIYNGEKYIAETIESIINQTFTDWEYILIDNASEDRSAEIIEAYAEKDSRIRLYRNEKNLGLVQNLNRSFELARGEYIARTDADDLSHPERLEKQYRYMEEHPETVLLGCAFNIWEAGSVFPERNEITFENAAEVRFVETFYNSISASSFFVRKKTVIDHKAYYKNYVYAEDFRFITDMLHIGEVYSLPEHLIIYRVYPAQTTSTVKAELRNGEVMDILRSNLGLIPETLRPPFQEALSGKLQTKEDIRIFTQAFVEYAKFCGLGNNEKAISENHCVRLMYRCIYDWQPGNLGLLAEYIRSPFHSRNWFLKRRGLSLIKQCFLHEDKRSKAMQG